ncbi:CHAD domain-containing protein [Nocardia sp. CS682]|uniref:CHAD domain-containing protein n=1 Tax=Nocardia sp. CS682 TaxID=1047172 RepID=UPI0010756C85|nr:CHAD domain-containing protein [Nocardia sp. CS682]QBS45335.1 hypothetical protein DMB37_39905 [Nocardia sp. CS682]
MNAETLTDAASETVQAANIAEAPGNSPNMLLAHYLDKQRTAITEGETAARRGEPGAVAAIIIAARRARSALAAHRSAAGRHAETRRLIEELRWLGVGLDLAHDLETQRTRITAAVDALGPRYIRGPVRTRIADYFDTRIQLAAAEAKDFLGSARYLTILDDLEVCAASLRDGSSPFAATERVDAILRDLLTRVRARIRAVDAATDEDAHDAAVHAVRKAARRMRYYLESIRQLSLRHCDGALVELTALQDVLGEHHDAVGAKHHLLELTREAEDAEETTFTYGVLYVRELDIADRCTHVLPGACSRALRSVRFIADEGIGASTEKVGD